MVGAVVSMYECGTVNPYRVMHNHHGLRVPNGAVVPSCFGCVTREHDGCENAQERDDSDNLFQHGRSP